MSLNLNIVKRYFSTNSTTETAAGLNVFMGNRGRLSAESPSGQNLLRFTEEVVNSQPEGKSLLSYYTNQNGDVESELLHGAVSLHDIHYSTVDLVRYYVQMVETIFDPPQGYIEPGEEEKANYTSFFLDNEDEIKRRKRITSRIRKRVMKTNDLILHYMWRKMDSHMRSHIPELSKDLRSKLEEINFKQLYFSEKSDDRIKAQTCIREMLLDKALLPNADYILKTLTQSVIYILNKGWSLPDMNLGNVVLYLKPTDEPPLTTATIMIDNTNWDECEQYINDYIDVKMIDWKYAIPPEYTKFSKYNAWDDAYGPSGMPGTNMSCMRVNMQSWPMYAFGSTEVQTAVEIVDVHVQQLRSKIVK